MRRILSLFLVVVLFLSFNRFSFAQIGIIGGGLQSTVSGTVGQFYLSVSGWASPFASVILTSGGINLRATVADQYGDFSISDVLIKYGFSQFCLDSTDFKHLGSSETCFNVSPATGSITMKDIFLPPTLALYKASIPQGGSTLAYGFTMPGALVTLYFNNGVKLTTRADSLGYYKFIIRDLKAGSYKLYAKAQYRNKESQSPAKTLLLTSLTWWQQLLAFLKGMLDKFIRLLTSMSLGPLWLVIPIIILIIILIFKLWGPKFTLISGHIPSINLPFLFKPAHKPLHHAWEFGY